MSKKKGCTQVKISDEQKNKLMGEYKIRDDKFNNKGELIASKLTLPNLGELIFNELGYHFLTTTDNSEIFYYNGGYYEQNGEQIIKDLVEQFLEEDTREHYKNEVVGYIRDKNYQKREIFDPPLHLINLKNGVYDIKKNKLLPHSPDYYFINEIPANYKEKADCPRIKQFLSEVVYKDDISVIQELFGYCLYRRYHIHKAFMFLGGGKNGKSTAIRLLVKFLGKGNVSNKELQDLMYNRFAVSALYGKLANLAADISDQALKRTGMFKMLTGEDRIDAEKKYKDSFSLVNYAKFIFSANKLPKSDDESYAYYRRWILISFPHTFEGSKCNVNILEEITTEEELSGLFNWAIEGLQRLLKNGDFSYGKTVDEVMEQYKTMSDPIYAYCQEYLKCTIGGHILKADLWAHYTKWCKKNKLPVTPKNILTQELGKHLSDMATGKAGGKGSQKPAYMNISWKNESNPDTDLTGGNQCALPYSNQSNPDTDLTGGNQ